MIHVKMLPPRSRFSFGTKLSSPLPFPPPPSSLPASSVIPSESLSEASQKITELSPRA